MRFSDFVRALGSLVTDTAGAFSDPELNGVCNDSRKAEPDKLFCAICGAQVDGHNYLDQAVKSGVSALCIASDFSGEIPDGVPVIRVSDSYHAWGVLCEEAYGRPADAFRVHTVAGTNGKTTSAFLLRHLLSGAPEHKKTALLSTVLYDVCSDNEVPAESFQTMPDAEHLQQFFCQIKANGATDAVMETSSHGLHQFRAGNLKFASAIFTNLTGDHLDYHKTFEAYYQAKKLLFTEMLAPNAPAVINIDDPWGKRLYDELAEYPVRRASLSATDYGAFCFLKKFTPLEHGSELEFVLDGKTWVLRSPFSGDYNAFNLLGAVTSVYLSSGLDMEYLIDRAETAQGAPGRLEAMPLPSGATAFIDYAHTDDALKRVLTSLRRILPSGGRLIAVFGCGGDRDRTKRPRMARVVSELADLAILTSDNPRTEDPLAIMAEAAAGLKEGFSCEKIADRAAAIRRAAAISKAGDFVLIAGKGHENYQIIGMVKHHFDDHEIVRSL